MTRKLRLYLDTSVWSFAFAEDAPDYRRDTIDFFEVARRGRFEMFASVLVLSEILRTRDSVKRAAMQDLFNEISPTLIEIGGESRTLARHYLAS